MTGRQQLGVVAIVLAVIAGGGFALTRALGPELHPMDVGTKAPPFSAQTLAPRPATRTLDDYRGQVVLLNIWATWCEPCRVEMPSIEQLYRDYAPKGLRVVAVSIDDPGTDAAIRKFATDYKLTFEILHDSSKAIENTYQATGVPETAVISRDGTIRKRIIGATDWSSEANRRLIDDLLAEK
jgi:peroxiredoxin